MAETISKVPITSGERKATATHATPATTTPATTVTRHDWHPFQSLRREIDHLFDDFDRNDWLAPFTHAGFGAPLWWRRESGASALAAVDVIDHDHEYRLTAELPGLDDHAISLTLLDRTLTLKGEKREETERKSQNACVSERRYGSFERAFHLPDDVDTSKISAHFARGVLTITLPKSAAARARETRIPIKGS